MEIATKIAPIGLALIMLTLGFGLTIQDFLRVIKTPKDFLIGFICQLILLPIVAFIIVTINKYQFQSLLLELMLSCVQHLVELHQM